MCRVTSRGPDGTSARRWDERYRARDSIAWQLSPTYKPPSPNECLRPPRQLRAGYPQRPRRFPQSVILCGVRDYRIHSSAEKTVITGGSAFNVKAASLRMGDFTEVEVHALLGQHTADTGQRFADAALQAVWELSAGQPWLVNALAQQACFTDAAGRDRRRNITAEAIHAAREQLILRRETHLDQLTDKLQEERVRRVVEPLLSGVQASPEMRPADLEYVRDLGLVGA